jgi:hypothetical protein
MGAFSFGWAAEMQVSLVQRHRQHAFDRAAIAPPQPLLAAAGARVVLGGIASIGVLAEPIRPAADTLFGPRGAVLAAPAGPLFVADTGHHRVLVWRDVPRADFTPANFVLGQPDFASEGRNAKRAIGPATLNVPTGIAVGGGCLAVADAWNHRVLLWHSLPDAPNRPADIVLGQADFAGGLANRGAAAPAADTLNWCYGVAICDGHLFVSDTGNRRVLVWNALPATNGAPADLVLGQRDFTTRDHGGGLGGASFMRWPHAVAIAEGRLFVADAGTSRIMMWQGIPATNGAPCNAVLGQAGFDGADHNRNAFDPTAATLNMPYGIATLPGQLVVADTANSRLLGYDLAALETGASADRLAGQRRYHDKGENRWERPGRDGLCWPYGVSTCGDTAIIADSGNNRVLLWGAA